MDLSAIADLSNYRETMKDDPTPEFRRLERESLTFDQLDERSKREDDVVAQLAAWAVCETAETAQDWGINWPNTPCGREARRTLEEARPKLFHLAGRKHQKRTRRKKETQSFGEECSNPSCNDEPENSKSEEAKSGTTIAWWVGQELWCDDCGYGARLEADDAKHPNWMHTGDVNVVRFSCLNCKAEMELSQRALNQLKKRAELGDAQAAAEMCGSIRMLIDWACNASNTTRGKVALAFLLGGFIPKFVAHSAWRLTAMRPIKFAPKPEWMAVRERSFGFTRGRPGTEGRGRRAAAASRARRGSVVSREQLDGGASPLLLAEWNAVQSDYLRARIRAEGLQPLRSQPVSVAKQARAGLLSQTDKVLIEIYEKGNPKERLEVLLLPRIEEKLL